MKLMIIGYGRHGKDSVAEFLFQEYNMKFIASSDFCSKHVVFPVLKDLYGYKTPEECFNDRSNHRDEWYNLISNFNKNDLARLGRKIYSVSDIYCGLRNRDEFFAIRDEKLFDYSIWVDRSQHLDPEPKSSNTIESWMADYIIDNNGTLEELHQNTRNLMNHLMNM